MRLVLPIDQAVTSIRLLPQSIASIGAGFGLKIMLSAGSADCLVRTAP